jgi:NADPH:quinone reductase-like Zn-dependent oxidoreductase
MKAVVVHKYGGPEVLKFEDYPVPGAGEVLVRVAAASVNPLDYKRRAGLTDDYCPIHFPGLIGVDRAGTVVKIGPEVEGFSVGDGFSLWRTILTLNFVSSVRRSWRRSPRGSI